jgi:hypothetical protein
MSVCACTEEALLTLTACVCVWWKGGVWMGCGVCGLVLSLSHMT